MNDPQQELFTKLLVELRAKGFDVYDGEMPPEDTQYPFVYLADCQQVDSETKTQVIGNVFQTINVWHNNKKQRGTVSNILLAIKSTCRNINHTDNFAWNVENVTQRIIPDNTTKTPLLHGILEVEFTFS